MLLVSDHFDILENMSIRIRNSNSKPVDISKFYNMFIRSMSGFNTVVILHNKWNKISETSNMSLSTFDYNLFIVTWHMTFYPNSYTKCYTGTHFDIVLVQAEHIEHNSKYRL